jgi:hypothetical protein
MTSKPATPSSEPRIPHTAGLSASMPLLDTTITQTRWFEFPESITNSGVPGFKPD